MAVYTLTFGIEIVVYAFFSGTAKVTMSLMGHNIGAKKEYDASRFFNICVWLNLGIGLLAGGIFLLFPSQLLGIFTKDTQTIHDSIPFLMFTAAIMIPKSLNVVLGSGIRAYKDTKWMLYTQIVGSIVLIACSCFLVLQLHMHIVAIYITLFFDETIRSIMNYIYYYRKYSHHAQIRRRIEG